MGCIGSDFTLAGFGSAGLVFAGLASFCGESVGLYVHLCEPLEALWPETTVEAAPESLLSSDQCSYSFASAMLGESER